MADFNERHAPTGRITNQPDGFDRDRPHASTSVCDREECQQKARFWVQGTTGEAGVYVPFRRTAGVTS
jgi:hypothetical protein